MPAETLLLQDEVRRTAVEMAAHRNPSAINDDGAPSTTSVSPCLSTTSLHHNLVILDDTNALCREHRDVSGTSSAVEYSAIPNDERLSWEIPEPFSTNSKGIVEVNANETENSGLLYQPLERLEILKQWAIELLLLFISVTAFAITVILLMAVNEKPQPAWAYVVNINTLVAIFTTLLRAAVLLIVAEVMGQAKWSWMASPRPLRHVEQFDNAGKGAWGSLKFLLNTWKPTPTMLGALVVIASYAIGPLSQQAVKTFPCEIQTEGVARISIAERIPILDVNPDSVGYISGEMSTVAITGLLGMLPDSSQLFDCDSGNCTFESNSGVTHSSVGVCSQCADVRSELHEYGDSETKVWDRYSSTYRFHDNTSFGIETAVEPTLYNVTTLFDGQTSFLTLTAARCVAKVNEEGQAKRYCRHNYENMPRLSSDLDIAAAKCTLYPCLRHYHGHITNGTFHEDLIRSQPMKKQSKRTFSDDPPYISMIEPCNIDEEWYDLSNITNAPRDGRNWTSWSSDGVSYETPGQCLRVMPSTEFMGLTTFLLDNLKGSCWWVKALYMNGNATFETFKAAHENMATAVTNRMRANGLTWSTTDTSSRSYKEGTCSQISICFYWH
ncbi:hypothetical protein LX32DRAFT_708586 [Colletotrichum zoysiae]|uniref:Uncharacterized protein n=1 Tax=Colletotrichum zoysiae TaxID=1216348 RepID=A0AAD9H6X3_9PEZI|nr:hypothetical protein LX32DRAFT_708586 [Colletotrichum zoysiae]